MYVSFSSAKVCEFDNARSFERRAGRWLTLREAENFYVLCVLPTLDRGVDPEIRLFTLEESGAVVAAGILVSGGSMTLTWATAELVEILADHAQKHHWQITSVNAPAHTSSQFAKAFADRTGRTVAHQRAERLYQIARQEDALPAGGRLEVAHAGDLPLVRSWFDAFAKQTQLEIDAGAVGATVKTLVEAKRLYLWKTPHAVAMASWVTSSPNGACINYVYVPPEFRGQGHGKAVSAALAAQVFASGSRYCFILADIRDARANHLYQSIGARTLCEMLHCRIVTRTPAATRMPEAVG